MYNSLNFKNDLKVLLIESQTGISFFEVKALMQKEHHTCHRHGEQTHPAEIRGTRETC